MLTENLENNITLIKKRMEKDTALTVRRINTRKPNSVKCALFFCDGTVDTAYLSEFVLRKVMNADLLSKSNALDVLLSEHIEAAQTEVEFKLEKLLSALNSGDGVLMVNGDCRFIIISAKGYMKRGVEEPQGESVSIGCHEGFVEPILHNMTLLRRRIKTDRLKFESFSVGKISPLSAVLCYIDGVADEKLVMRMQDRLKKIEHRDIQNINALAECIKDSPFSVFQTAAQTERPDVAASRLLEGRVAVILDGSCAVLTAPALLTEFFQTADDYYLNFYYSSVSRLLRIVCFFLTVSIPGLYVGILTYHRSLLPTDLLISIAQARSGVPFPLLLETVILLIAFDLLQDASAHVSSSLGQSLSIVGALVLGESAVSAHFISAPLVIITAATGITGLINSSVRSATIAWRYILLVFCAAAGLYGYIFGGILMLITLCRLESFGVPYAMNLFPVSLSQTRDTVIRSPWKLLKYRNIFRRSTK